VTSAVKRGANLIKITDVTGHRSLRQRVDRAVKSADAVIPARPCMDGLRCQFKPGYSVSSSYISLSLATLLRSPAAQRRPERARLEPRNQKQYRSMLGGRACKRRCRQLFALCRDELAALYIHGHSITSSARASSVGGTVRPSALAVFRLMTSSNVVGN
jgi:hypothetical protein